MQDYEEEFKRAVDLFFNAYEVLLKLREDTWIHPMYRALIYSHEERIKPGIWDVLSSMDLIHPLLRKAAKEVSYYAHLVKKERDEKLPEPSKKQASWEPFKIPKS